MSQKSHDNPPFYPGKAQVNSLTAPTWFQTFLSPADGDDADAAGTNRRPHFPRSQFLFILTYSLFYTYFPRIFSLSFFRSISKWQIESDTSLYSQNLIESAHILLPDLYVIYKRKIFQYWKEQVVSILEWVVLKSSAVLIFKKISIWKTIFFTTYKLLLYYIYFFPCLITALGFALPCHRGKSSREFL